MRKPLATGGLMAGCYFVRSRGLTTIRTAREVEHVLSARWVSPLAVCLLPGGRGMETIHAPDEASLARWACRLAVELGGAVEMRVTP